MTALRSEPPSEGSPTACWAPSTALYFEPDGTVRACCSSSFSVGTVGIGPDRQPLADIWEGALLAAQREALGVGDFSRGCQECGAAVAAGHRSASLAHDFDEFAAAAAAGRPVFMDFALSNRCNLQCVMCNGELSSSIRHAREGRPPLPAAYDDRFFDELTPFLPSLQRALFKGGEPFLAPEAARVWDLMAEHAPGCRVSVTTNGTIWSDRVAQLVHDRRMQVNISVDGMTSATVEAIRVGATFSALWRNIDRFQEITDANGSGLTLNFCLVRSNWHELHAFLAECDRRHVPGIVIVVNQPAAHSLLFLTKPALGAVVDEMEAIGRTSVELSPSSQCGPTRSPDSVRSGLLRYRSDDQPRWSTSHLRRQRVSSPRSERTRTPSRWCSRQSRQR